MYKFVIARAGPIKRICLCADQVLSLPSTSYHLSFFSLQKHVSGHGSVKHEDKHSSCAQWTRTCLPEKIRKKSVMTLIFSTFSVS